MDIKNSKNYEKHMEWKKNNPEKVQQHSKTYTEKNRELINKKNNKAYWLNREKRLLQQKQFKARKRIKLIEKFGGKCFNCGYNTDIRALQIDHKNGGGTKHRKEFTNTNQYYSFLLAYEGDEFQILCANCNWIKRYENNEERK